jgi:putative ABC transport system permease protein
MRNLLQDLRYALRMLAKNPGFTIVALLTLALGIGANTAIFSVVNTVLLKPLPYARPEGLVKVWGRFTGIGLPNDLNWFSAPEYRDLRDLNRSFSDITVPSGGVVNLGVSGYPQSVNGAQVSPSMFSILGISPIMGRTFTPEEATQGHDRVVILGYSLWQREFHGRSRPASWRGAACCAPSGHGDRRPVGRATFSVSRALSRRDL